jgi:hypothetical protein
MVGVVVGLGVGAVVGARKNTTVEAVTLMLVRPVLVLRVVVKLEDAVAVAAADSKAVELTLGNESV